MITDKFIFFWGGECSQWYPSLFVIDGANYSSCEQYMMAKKAEMFGDRYHHELIMRSTSPRQQKEYGRKVVGFDKAIWESKCRDIIFRGNLAKFTQDPDLLAYLLSTGDREIVEASPEDTIWGIGLAPNDPRVLDKKKWKGTNWLGIAIMQVRDHIRSSIYKMANPEHSAKAGVSIIIVDKRDRVLVGKRKGSHGAGLLSIPGGHLEFGETIATCCDRELTEEIGNNFNGNYTKLSYSEDFFQHNDVLKHYVTLYLVVRDVDSETFEVKNMEPNKCEGWEWIHYSKLPEQMFCDTHQQIKNLFTKQC